MRAVGEHRAVFDFRITFTNGGEITGRDFRLDVPGPDVGRSDVGLLLVRHLGLLMVDQVELDPFQIVEEAHRGGRGMEGTVAAGPARRVVDLSHPISHGMVTYPGLPGPQISDHLTRAASEETYGPGVTFHIGRISMVANTGTYLDSPYHRYAGGDDLAALPLNRLVDLNGIVVRVSRSGSRAVDVAQLAPYETAGRAVLIHTGWDRHWGTSAYGSNNPYLTAAGATWLVEQGAALVGIDSANIDDTGDRARPAHSRLLTSGTPIVEHLCLLDQLPPEGFRFHAAPPAIHDLGTFPTRAYALIDSIDPSDGR